MFRTMFDLITMDYIMEHIEFTDKHASISGRDVTRTLIGGGVYSYIHVEILPDEFAAANIETAKYLHKVGENLIFLFTPIFYSRIWSP